MGSGNIPYKSILIVGCGDVGQSVAAQWAHQAVDVYGLRRQPPASWQGIRPVATDLDEPAPSLDCPTEQALIYYFAPPPPRGSHDSRAAHFLAALANKPRPARLVVISTSGVYGDRGGRWVSEEAQPAPAVDRARRRWDMEQQFRRWCEAQGVDLIILRVGGIYGPGRLPLKRIREGIPVLREDLAPSTNRIHVDDLARVCVAAARVDRRFRVYNVSDGQQSNMTEYFLTLADYFGLPRPPQVDWAQAEQVMSEGMLSYLRESRRMDTSRMRAELDVQLQYPTLEQGLASCREDVKAQ